MKRIRDYSGESFGRLRRSTKYQRVRSRSRKTQTGLSAGPLRGMYAAWNTMKQRCLNPKQCHYHLYGGRGITICDRWLSFENFLEDMGVRPEGTFLERQESSRGYEPGNCVWSPRARKNRLCNCKLMLTVGVTTKPLAEWAEETGIPYATMKSRMEAGWTHEDCVNRPLKKRKGEANA
jgi:hypothetical protein